MAPKPPPPPWDLLQQASSRMGGELDKGARALAQSALSKLDVVSRDEFDAQSALLERTRERVIELENTLEALASALEEGNNEV